MSTKNGLSTARVSPVPLSASLLASDRILRDIRIVINDLARATESISGQRIDFGPIAEDVDESMPISPLSYISEDITNSLSEVAVTLQVIVSELQRQVSSE